MKIQEYTSLGELKKDLIKSNNIKKTDTEFEIIVCQNIYDKIQEELRQEFGHNLVVTSEDKNLFTQLTTLKKENITFKYSCFFIEDYPFTKITFKIN
jgi:hypothetical protein